MSKATLKIQSADEAETVFYEAFMHGDIDVMAALWAKGEVVCIHPGSGVVSGYEAVVRSWRHILEDAQGPDVRYTLLNQTQTDEIAIHLVAEEIMQDGVIVAVVIATNVYQKFDHGWLMTEHHSSIVQQEHHGETLQ